MFSLSGLSNACTNAGLCSTLGLSGASAGATLPTPGCDTALGALGEAESKPCTSPAVAHGAELHSGQDRKDENSLQGEDMEDDMPSTQPAFAQEAHAADVKAETGQWETLAGEVCRCSLSFLHHTSAWFDRYFVTPAYICQLQVQGCLAL